jgi:uncharacterized protein YndB with AHSA1/START domain
VAAEATMQHELRESVLIDAEPEEIYSYFTDSAAMVEWMGQSARLDPRVGGELQIEINDSAVRGRYLLLDPPRRIVFSWGFASSDELPPEASTVEVKLTKETGGTRVELVHSGLPEPERDKHAHGWHYFLARLVAAQA